MIRKCLGCGIKLQSENEEELGYIPKTKTDTAKYCERCFKLIHYNKASIAKLPEETTKIIDIVNSKGKYAFFLIDFLNINSTTLSKFKEVLIPKTLIISKCDIIPKSIKENTLIDYLKKEYDITDNIIFISSTKKKNLNKIPNIMKEHSIKEAYVLGYTNSGKSTLINYLYEKLTDKKSNITTSLVPNTTLDFIKLKITDEITLIDSPGFTMINNFYNNDEIDLIKKIDSKKYLKPITYQSKDNMYLNLENKIILKLNDNHNSLTYYLSNSLNIKKEFKLSNNNLNKMDFKINDNSDLVIKGIGFINIKKACIITIYSEDFSLIEIRNSVF